MSCNSMIDSFLGFVALIVNIPLLKVVYDKRFAA